MSHCGCIIESVDVEEGKVIEAFARLRRLILFIYLLVSFSNKTGSIGSCATFRSESPRVCLRGGKEFACRVFV